MNRESIFSYLACLFIAMIIGGSVFAIFFAGLSLMRRITG